PPPPPPSLRSGPSAPPLSVPRAPAVPSALNAYSGDTEDDAPTRLYASGSGSAPPPPTKTMPRNERPLLAAQPAPAQKAALFPASAPGNKNTLYMGVGAAVVLLAAAAFYFLGARTGGLTITVSGPGGRPVEGVEVFIDGAKKCGNSPCRVPDLAAGAHLVRAAAKGYQDTADQAVSVESGKQSTHNVSLVTAGAGTGVRVSALGSGLRLYVDGQQVGELPQTAKNLTPGEHTLRVAGSDRYEAWEERVTLEDGEMKTLGPLKLRVKKGLATFKAGPGADGARVLLDGRLVPELPATIEVPAGKQLTLVATKSGYSTYRRNVSFEDGVAEKSFEITMAEGGSEETASAPAADEPAPTQHSMGKTTAATHHATPAPAPAPAPGPVRAASRTPGKGKAVLNINSIPVTNVILNGRPIGATPKVGVQVTPGPQTVVFVHATLGRKVQTGTVGEGETKTFMAKLP
ncbi:MAG TPA: carboxypeptidase regulatory-like domain-containing protein, partial [Polyangiaceae bacterium]